ncbi:MAG: response regulator [Eubacteriales bacterium]|nr:response regulator [Eubacteriales bacterium]
MLIVDDDPMILDGLCARPEWNAMGFEVAGCAEDGREALEWLAHNRADLVVTDIVMCNMSGLELARTLWERGYPARVVLLSAHGEFDYARQGIAYGVAAYLLKPVRHEELLTVLNETASALENRREDRGAPIEDDEDEGLVLRVERYVRAHIAEELSVARVAEAMHYSERHFRRQFQKEARCQISDFMTRVRIARARELLSDGLSCEETARAVGYSGERYFKKVFHEITGESVAMWQSRRKGVRP